LVRGTLALLRPRAARLAEALQPDLAACLADSTLERNVAQDEDAPTA